MPQCSVVVLPGELTPPRAMWTRHLIQAGFHVVDVDLPIADPAPLSVRACAAIHAASPPGPVVVVAPQASSGILAAVALAQRRAHRGVAAYLLIDPVEDPTGQDWPDAPVIALDSGDLPDLNRHARLRGWGLGPAGPEQLTAAIEEFAT